MPAPAEVQKETLTKFLDAWAAWDADAFVALWSDDFTFQQLPLSVGKPTQPRAMMEVKYRRLMGVLTDFKLDIKSIVHDAAQNKACVYGVLRADAPCGAYANEQSVFITFDESGKRIAHLEEMNDNKARLEWEAKYHQYYHLS